MSERPLHPANVGAAALLIGGILTVAFPQHALTLLQLVVLTTAISFAVYALAAHVPTSGWISPYKWLSPFGPTGGPGHLEHRSDEIDFIRARLGDRRQHVDGAPPMPPAVLRQLKPLIASALDVDTDDPEELEAARDRVPRGTWAVLLSEPLERPTWFRTVPPDASEVSEVVHAVMDDLARLTGAPPPPSRITNSSLPGDP